MRCWIIPWSSNLHKPSEHRYALSKARRGHCECKRGVMQSQLMPCTSLMWRFTNEKPVTFALGQRRKRELHFIGHSTESQQGAKIIHLDMVKGWEWNCIFSSTSVPSNQMLVGQLHVKDFQSLLHTRASTVCCIHLQELSTGSQSYFTRNAGLPA